MGPHLLARGMGGWAGFVLGVAVGVLIETVGPDLAKNAGPAARSALKGLFRLTDDLSRCVDRFRQKAEEFVADTRAEYDAEQEAPPREAGPDEERPPTSEA